MAGLYIVVTTYLLTGMILQVLVNSFCQNAISITFVLVQMYTNVKVCLANHLQQDVPQVRSNK